MGCPPWDTNTWGEPRVPGDADFNGLVNDTDYTIWYDNCGKTPEEWPEGTDLDFNNNKIVDLSDYYIWVHNYGKKMEDYCLHGERSWHTMGGGDYLMWQELNSTTVDAAKGNVVIFSFWFYPESAVSNGSENKAQAEIYYEYQGGKKATQFMVDGFLRQK